MVNNIVDQSDNNLNINPPKNSIIYAVFFEIFFTTFLCCFILFALNFLNIVNLGRIVPFLSALPHLNEQHNIQESTSTSFKANPSPNQNQTQDQMAIFIYLSNFLVSSVLPSKNFEHSIYSKDTTDNIYTADWGINTNDTQANLKLKMRQYSYTLYDLTIRIDSKTDSDVLLNNNLANQLIQKYFTSTIGINWSFNCDNSKSSCSSEIISKEKKIKISMYTTTDIPGRVFILFCTVSNKSPLYNQSNYCLL